MKAFRTTISKGFTEKGIRSSNNPQRNSGFFEECRQARVSGEGLEGYMPAINNILDPSCVFYDSVTGNEITITQRWPFPQVFLTDVGLFIGAKEGLYNIIDTTPTIILLDYTTGDTYWPWVCIPIMGYPAFTSGDKFVYYDSNAASYLVVS